MVAAQVPATQEPASKPISTRPPKPLPQPYEFWVLENPTLGESTDNRPGLVLSTDGKNARVLPIASQMSKYDPLGQQDFLILRTHPGFEDTGLKNRDIMYAVGKDIMVPVERLLYRIGRMSPEMMKRFRDHRGE